VPTVERIPRAGVDYPGTWQAFEEWFPDDVACRRYLAGLRWPAGFRCPICGSGEEWVTGRGLWMCRQCGRQTSVTAGTIFHRSRYPLRTWFAAAWFVCAQKNGASALGLQRVLGFGSYETAWAWMHKLRRAMVRPELLSGTVELDETFVGGRSMEGRRARYQTKATVAIAVERLEPKGLGRVRLRRIGPHRKQELFAFAGQVLSPGTILYTDGASLYQGLDRQANITIRATSMVASNDPAHRILPASGGGPAEKMAGGNPPSRADRRPSRLLPRRVHLPVQPSQQPISGAALLPPVAASHPHRPPSPQDPRQSHTQ
jgi:hypothetical protein